VTRREREVLAALGERLTNAEIAERLALSERTIESHVSSLLRKLEAANRIELAGLARQVFRGDRAGPRVLPPALRLLADPKGYCGREDERAQVDRLWARATAGTGQLLVGVVAGEAGIGKSRLAAEVAAAVHEDGARVLLGACTEDGVTPYEPFVQAIGDDLVGLDDHEVRDLVGAEAEPLSRILPGLAARLGTPPAHEVFDAAAGQAEIYAALLGYLTRSARRGPTLVVIDDVHWAGATTMGALRHLARTSGDAPVLVVLTTRVGSPDADGDVALLLADLARMPSVGRIDLEGLDVGAVAALIERLGGSGDPAAVHAETGGNPLFVREVADSTGSTGGSLASLLTRRDALLDADDLAVLDLAAVVGVEHDADLLAAAAGTTPLAVLESLERAEAAGLVLAAPGRPGRFAFTHGLFRTARHDALPTARRMVLHQQVATALAARDPQGRDLAELARHACAAAPLGDARAALEHTVRAAAEAERALALGEATELYRAALEVTEFVQPPDPDLRLRLSVRLGEVMQGAQLPGWRSVLLDAADQARALGDTAALAEVGWAWVRYGGPSNPGATDAEFAALMQEALAALGPEPTAARARTLGSIAESLCFTDPETATAMVDEARSIARRLDDPTTLGHVLLSYRVAALGPDNHEARYPTADELIVLGHRTRQSIFTMLGLAHRASVLREAGDLAAADVALDGAVALQGGRPLPAPFQASVLLYQAARAGLAGDLVGAEAIADQVWDLAVEGFDPTNWYGPAVVMIRHLQGRLPELVPLMEGTVDQTGIGIAYRAALAVGTAQVGRADEARTILRELLADDLAGIPRNFMWLTTLVALAEVAEQVGDGASGQVLATRLLPYRGRMAAIPQAVIGPIDLAIAQSLLAAGDHERAASIAADAASAARSQATPVYLARALVRLAVARRSSGAADAGANLLSEALRLADATGGEIVVLDARQLGLLD
jgi:DNA-binding CsgD family transcriptional regulator